MKNLIFFFMLLHSINMMSQSQDNKSIFVLIDSIKNENLFVFEKEKNSTFAKIKILYFSKREEGFKIKKQTQAEEDIIFVNSEPPRLNYYEFVSTNSPKIIRNIDELKTHSIKDVSQNKIWNDEYPYIIIFIERLKCNKYNLWEMRPIMQE